MTINTIDRPHRPTHQLPSRGSHFSGTLGLLRLYLRRDRIVLPLWVLLLSVPLSTVYIGSIEAVYPSQADRATFAATIMASPAQRALYGNVYGDSLGATGIWKAGMFGVLIAVAVILTVIRHTRADEETGRSELIDSTAVGRYASLTAALLLACGASLLTGVIGFAGLLTVDVPAAGSLAFGSALACSGLVFTGVAAVTAQLSPSARFARGAAFGVLAAAFTLRAVGDASSEASTLSWLSPLGWALQVRPYAGDRFWVLLLPVATTVLLIGVAYQLLARRDVGAGLIAERPGPPRAGASLHGPTGLAWRLSRGALVLWTVGLVAYGLLIGSVVEGIGDEIGNSATVRDIVARLGGTDAMEQAFVAVAFSMVGMIAAAFATSLTLRLHQEESTQHAETLLAGAVSRTRWLAGTSVDGTRRLGRRHPGLGPGRWPHLWRRGWRRRGQPTHRARHRGRATACGVADGCRHRRVVRARPKVHPGGLGCTGRVHRGVSAWFAGELTAVAGRPRTVRTHPAGGFRRLHCDPAGVAVGHRRRVDHIGRHRLSPP